MKAGDKVSMIIWGIQRVGVIVRIHTAKSGTCRVRYATDTHDDCHATIPLANLTLL